MSESVLRMYASALQVVHCAKLHTVTVGEWHGFDETISFRRGGLGSWPLHSLYVSPTRSHALLHRAMLKHYEPFYSIL